MGWLKLDDAFGTHPKIAGLSDRAFRAHVLGMLYAAQHMTDGIVPDSVAPSRAITRELEGGRYGPVWTRVDGGWQVHDFLDYNPSKAQAKASAIAKAMAGAKGAASRWHGRENAPSPSPAPTPRTKKPSTPRERDVIADALARAEHAEPLEVPASRMKTLCVKAIELRKVSPGVTPEEVARRALNWSAEMGDATISGPAIVTHWGRLGASKAHGNGQVSTAVPHLFSDEFCPACDVVHGPRLDA